MGVDSAEQNLTTFGADIGDTTRETEFSAFVRLLI